MEVQQIKQMISNALRSVRQALRGKVTLTDSSKQLIRLQVDGLAGETFNGAEYFQHAGYRAVPVKGTQPIIIPLNGKSANGVIVACSNGALFITDLAEGEVAIFNEKDGVNNSIILRNGKIADITCDVLNIKAATSVNIDTPQMTVNATSAAQINTPKMTVNASDAVQLNTPTTTASTKLVVGANAQIAGATSTLTLSVTSPVAGASHMAGGITADGEIISGGISVPHHTHSGIQPGSGNTGAPQ